jgi:hypothetical protein
MKVHVKNAPGEDYDPDDSDYSDVPAGYISWIDYWNQSHFSDANACFNCGKKTDDLDGGHVYYLKKDKDGNRVPNESKGIFIIPLCSKCNNPNNTKSFQVDDSDLIEVPKKADEDIFTFLE